MKKIFILSLILVLIISCVGVVRANEYKVAVNMGSESVDYSNDNSKLAPQFNKDISDTSLELPNPVKDKTIMDVVNRLLGYLLIFSLPVAVFFIMLAGYNIMVAQGDAAKVKKAWDMIRNVLIGLVIIFLSKTIVWLIVNILSGEM